MLARWYAAYDMVVADPERAKRDKGVRPGGACVPGQAEREPGPGQVQRDAGQAALACPAAAVAAGDMAALMLRWGWSARW